MFANPQSIAEIFESSCQYLIPVYQRHYVWDRESQWEGLWSDLVSQTRTRLERQTPRPHFCGAIVVDQKKNQAVTDIPRYHVIDGQQRLTTFQVILAAIRDICHSKELPDQLKRVIPYIINHTTSEQADPVVDQYKLRPTRYDTASFIDVITFGDSQKIRTKYVTQRTVGRSRPPVPKIVSAYIYFYDQIARSINQQEDVFGSETYTTSELISAIFDAFVSFFRSVIIMLDSSDDAQIIFETLNSRGTPLLASDLMRNYIFLRAELNHENVDTLFDKHWAPEFEQNFWTVEQKQGRITKPRIEFLMTNILAERTATEIQLNKIYQEYLAWINANAHALTVEQELKDLGHLASVYRVLVEAHEQSPLGAFAQLLREFDVTTVFTFLMAVWTEGPIDESERQKILSDLESFIIRRLVCRRDMKNFTRFFLTVIKELRPKKFSATAFREMLSQQTSETSDWPTDEEFRNHWLVDPAYGRLHPSRVAYILQRIEGAQVTKFSEEIAIKSKLSVEHVMPRRWFTTWPLSDGTLVSEEFAGDAKTKQQLGLHLDSRSVEAARRQIVVDTLATLHY